MTYVVKTSVPVGELFEFARRELTSMDGALVMHDPKTLNEVLGVQLARDRFVLTLMAIFACVAVSLAAVGIYGVLAYSVNQRVHEIGIRMALGARGGRVRAIVVGQTAAVVGLGMATGLAGAFGFSRFLQSLLFEVSVRDPVVFATVPPLLAAVAMVSMLIPAHKATRVDPVNALTAE
jgi:ABC-type antimicrobial peptide transport system permease subunit